MLANGTCAACEPTTVVIPAAAHSRYGAPLVQTGTDRYGDGLFKIKPVFEFF